MATKVGALRWEKEKQGQVQGMVKSTAAHQEAFSKALPGMTQTGAAALLTPQPQLTQQAIVSTLTPQLLIGSCKCGTPQGLLHYD